MLLYGMLHFHFRDFFYHIRFIIVLYIDFFFISLQSKLNRTTLVLHMSLNALLPTCQTQVDSARNKKEKKSSNKKDK